jgi:hypothetical protein
MKEKYFHRVDAVIMLMRCWVKYFRGMTKKVFEMLRILISLCCMIINKLFSPPSSENSCIVTATNHIFMEIQVESPAHKMRTGLAMLHSARKRNHFACLYGPFYLPVVLAKAQ